MNPSHVLCLMAALATATARPMDQVIAHIARVRRFSCSQPQERAVSVTEVVTQSLNTSQQLSPSMTVVRRCDGGSGCCLGFVDHTCTPVEFQNVTLYFEVVSQSPGVAVSRPEVIAVEYQEHKKCDCRPRVHGGH